MARCIRPRQRRRLAFPLAIAALLSWTGAVAAVSPCPPVSYVVTYSSPLCNVTLLPHSGSLPLGNVWWAAWWRGAPNFTTGEGFERASDHVNVSATSLEQVAVQDRDGDRNLTEGDVLEVWSPGGCGGDLVVYLGPNATAFNGQLSLHLEAGYMSPCGTIGPDPLYPLVLVAIAVAAVAIPLVIVLIRRRRRLHG